MRKGSLWLGVVVGFCLSVAVTPFVAACPEHRAGTLSDTPVVSAPVGVVSRPKETPPGCLSSSSSQPCVAYDARTDEVWIHANGAELGQVLSVVAEAVGVEIDSRDEAWLKDRSSIDVGPLAVTNGLKMLLAGFNSTFTYGAPNATVMERAPLEKVVIVSRRSGPAIVIASAPEPGEAPPGALADVAPVPRLVGILTGRAQEAATQLVQALADLDREERKQAVVDGLLASLDPKNPEARDHALEALKTLAPDQAVTTVATWLHAPDVETRLQGVLALGRLGHDSAVAPLAGALADGDADIRRVAAHSLTRIPGPGSRNALIQTYLSADDQTREAVRQVIESHGDADARQAIARIPGER